MTDTLENPAETKSAIGNIQLHDGKAEIMTETGLVPYDLSYIILQIRKALKGPCRGYFADKMRYAGFISLLERDGLAACDAVIKRVKRLAIARDSNKNLMMFVMDHLDKLTMFSRINTTPKKEEESAVIENKIAEPATEEELVRPEDGEGRIQYWKKLRDFRPLTLPELEAEARDWERQHKPIACIDYAPGQEPETTKENQKMDSYIVEGKEVTRCGSECPYNEMVGGPGPVEDCAHPQLKKDGVTGYGTCIALNIMKEGKRMRFPTMCPLPKLSQMEIK